MLVARAAGSLVRQRAIVPAIQHRSASTSSHDDHHDSHHREDTTVYPQESFLSSFWAKCVLVAALGGAALKFAPERGDDAFFTRWIKETTTSPETWLDMNAHHTTQSKRLADQTQLFATAQRPRVNRYRFAQNLNSASAYDVPVGMSVDMSNVLVKRN
ncbi:hypothetical protein D9758_013011 [Tetrapyrgos nigripes]|uniref:Uncharacterized protein n=1 Tax=Tetrapyrgos nigripes TaxID=182062 RepID=A0A8H5CAR4_9AGAR|nr:hypothetical protein D9758_013011 [Tetrapyrgos nigripes]